MNLLVIAGLWYACGFGLAINEMRYDVDITIKAILCAAILAVLGPMLLTQTAERLGWLDRVIIERRRR